MNLQIVFTKKDELDGKDITFSKSFSIPAEGVEDENLKTFAGAYASLVDGDSYDSYKITKVEL